MLLYIVHTYIETKKYEMETFKIFILFLKNKFWYKIYIHIFLKFLPRYFINETQSIVRTIYLTGSPCPTLGINFKNIAKM